MPGAWKPWRNGSPLHACPSRCLGETGPGSVAASGGGPGPRSCLLARCTSRTGWRVSKRTPRHIRTVSRRATRRQTRHENRKIKWAQNRSENSTNDHFISIRCLYGLENKEANQGIKEVPLVVTWVITGNKAPGGLRSTNSTHCGLIWLWDSLIRKDI